MELYERDKLLVLVDRPFNFIRQESKPLLNCETLAKTAASCGDA